MYSSGIKKWLYSIKQKKKIETLDLDIFSELFYVSIQNVNRLYKSTYKIDDINLKINLQILALEEIAKPILLSNLIPGLNAKWMIEEEKFKETVKGVTDHPTKQTIISSYGKALGILKYKINLTEEEVKNLEEIRQKGLYTDIDPDNKIVINPYLSVEKNKVLSKKLDKFFKERILSLREMYASLNNVKVWVYMVSLHNKFSSKRQLLEFLDKTELSFSTSFNDLIKKIEEFKPSFEHDVIVLDSTIGTTEAEGFFKKELASCEPNYRPQVFSIHDPLFLNRKENFEKNILEIKKISTINDLFLYSAFAKNDLTKNQIKNNITILNIVKSKLS